MPQDHSNAGTADCRATMVPWPAIPKPLLYSATILLMVLAAWQILTAINGVTVKPQQLTQSAINPNTAPWGSLTRLPGVGPARAQKIITYRERYLRQWPAHLPFTNIQSMRRIKGFGAVTLRNLKPYLRFGNGHSAASHH